MRDMRKLGIRGETVSRLVREGVAVRLARGLYEWTEALPDTWRSYAEASAQVPHGVICLISALQFHELTVEMPPRVWMAVGRNGWQPKVRYPQIEFSRFGERHLETGVRRHLIDGVEVPIFEPVKTIVDCFRYRNKIGVDVALEGLAEGMKARKATPDELWKFARPAGVWEVMLPYIEVLLGDRNR